MKQKHCNWCDNTFETSISYQIYCSTTCRSFATKEKIAARYLLTRRSKRAGKERSCKSCGSKLSIYNDDVLCQICVVNPKDVAEALKDIKGLMNGKNWTN
jgi:hypothetical protein